MGGISELFQNDKTKNFPFDPNRTSKNNKRSVVRTADGTGAENPIHLREKGGPVSLNVRKCSRDAEPAARENRGPERLFLFTVYLPNVICLSVLHSVLRTEQTITAKGDKNRHKKCEVSTKIFLNLF